MNYTIDKTKRNMIIFSSAFLILYFLIVGLFFLIMGPTKLDTLQFGIKKVLYLIPYGYLMLIFFDYFRYYHLKVLQIATITIFTCEVVTLGIQFANVLLATLPKFILFTINIIWITATIIWIIFLFIPKMKDYPALISIRKYAMGPVLIFLIGFSIPFFVKPDNTFVALQMLCLICGIPYIFTIDYSMKLQLKE